MSTPIDQQEQQHRIPTGTSSASSGGMLTAFVGTTPNIGTTLVSFGTAVAIARATSKTVGYLCLNLKSSKLHRYLGRNDVPFGLNQLRADLRSHSLTRQRLLQSCDRLAGLPNLSVLFGSTLREQAEFFQPDDFRHLLLTARSLFDICIVEVSAYWDNAATIQAILDVDERIVVTTPDITHFQEDRIRWLHTLTPLFGIELPQFKLVLTQADKPALTGGIGWRDVEKETGLPVWAQIPRREDVLSRLNQGKLLELVKEHAIAEALDGLARTCMRSWGMGGDLPAASRRRIFKFMPNLS